MHQSFIGFIILNSDDKRRTFKFKQNISYILTDPKRYNGLVSLWNITTAVAHFTNMV